jgi:hypothetical protein
VVVVLVVLSLVASSVLTLDVEVLELICMW